MYHPLTRVLTLLHILKVNPTLTGDQLAAELQVDVRTVRRYVMMLRDLGIPIESQAGNHGGYSLLPRHPLPPTIFTRAELESMLHVLETIDSPAATSAKTKIKTLLAQME